MKKPLIFFIFLLLVLSIVSALPGDDCTYVGSRGKAGCVPGEYCSEELECQLLKLENIDCQNNYECDNFRCLEGTCGGETAVAQYAETFSWLKKLLFWLQGKSIRCDDGTAAGECSDLSTTIIGYRCGFNTITERFEIYADMGCRLAGTCTDSDVDTTYPDGINYFTQGTVVNTNFAGTTDTDFCTGSILTEYYCGGPNLDITSNIPSLCTAGCQNGECLPLVIPDCTANNDPLQCLTPLTEPICDVANGVCTSCILGWQGDNQCQLKYNNPNYECMTDGSCQIPLPPECTANDDPLQCTTPTLPICDVLTETCIACTTDLQCTTKIDSTYQCNVGTGECEVIPLIPECTSDADCTVPGEVCDLDPLSPTYQTCIVPPTTLDCTDNDNTLLAIGQDPTPTSSDYPSSLTASSIRYFTQGNWVTIDDSCTDATTLNERWCSPSEIAMLNTMINCENGCLNGECLPQVIPECTSDAECTVPGEVCDLDPLSPTYQTCIVPPPVCSVTNCDLCTTQATCEAETCNWWSDSTCNLNTEPPVCTLADCTAAECQTQTECETAGCAWDGTECSAPLCLTHDDCTTEGFELCDLDLSSTTYHTCIVGYRIRDQDAYFYEDLTNPEWVWDIENLDATTPTTITQATPGTITVTGIALGIENNNVYDEFTDGPVMIGDCYYYPHNYIKVCLDSTDGTYGEISIAGRAGIPIEVTEGIIIGEAIAGTQSTVPWQLAKTELGILDTHKITFNTQKVNAHEEIILSQLSPSIEDATTSSDLDYGNDIAMELSMDSLRYYYVFDDGIDLTTITQNNPLEIEFLGKQLKIVGIVTNPSIIIDAIPIECSDSIECLPDKICISNSCIVPECFTDSDCSSGQYCSSVGTCLTEADDDDGGQAPSQGRRRYTETGIDTEINQRIQATQSYCGDGTCYFGETQVNCPTDCKAKDEKAYCGDGISSPPVENCENCPFDVVCASNEECVNKECVEKGLSFWWILLIILLILILLIAAIIYRKSRKTKITKTVITKRPTTDEAKKRYQQELLRRRQQLMQRKQQLLIEQRKRQGYQRRAQQQRLSSQRQQFQSQLQKQQYEAKIKQQQLRAQKRRQQLLAKMREQELLAKKKPAKKKRKKRKTTRKKKTKRKKRAKKKKTTVTIKQGKSPGTKITIK